MPDPTRHTTTAAEMRLPDFPTHDVSFPQLVSIEATCRALDTGRTKVNELISSGHLVARKLGSQTKVEAQSIRDFVASLPRAQIRMGKSAS